MTELMKHHRKAVNDVFRRLEKLFRVNASNGYYGFDLYTSFIFISLFFWLVNVPNKLRKAVNDVYL